MPADAAGPAHYPVLQVTLNGQAINGVIVRILLFYVGSLAVIMAVTPWQEIVPGQSPFVSMFSLAGLATLRVDDDISQLQALPQHLLAQEKAITALTGQSVVVSHGWYMQ